MPDSKTLQKVYPDRATRLGVGGEARMHCKVSVLGLLENCEIVSESPADFGFGAAALKLAPYFVIRPRTVDGVPVGGWSTTVPIRFNSGPPSGGAPAGTANSAPRTPAEP